MSGAASKKELLLQYNHFREKEFKVNDAEEMILARPSLLPGYAASNSVDVYKKKTFQLGEKSKIAFITKNDSSESFVWTTTREKIKEAARWGIIRTDSLTGKAIGALGEYRVLAHERIARGLISNTHSSKIALVEVYQRQWEALQELEYLVNLPNSIDDFEKAVEKYLAELNKIKADLPTIFKDTLISKEMKKTMATIENDIEDAKNRANHYLKKLKPTKIGERIEPPNRTVEIFEPPQVTLESASLATGLHSIQQFAKRQMTRGMYRLSGINQDLSFINKREFAFSRGELNSCIEDALKEMHDFDPDIVNSVRPEHHGLHGHPDETISYNFGEHSLTAEKERRAVLAISLIEGCDKINTENNTIESKAVNGDSHTADLMKIAATSWTTTRGWMDSLSRMGHGIWNMIKSVVISTRPWNGNPWGNGFELFAYKLREHTKPNEPLWKKPWHLIVLFGNNLLDLGRGIKDIGSSLSIEIPNIFQNAWKSTKKITWSAKKDLGSSELSASLAIQDKRTQIERAIQHIKKEEDDRLDELLHEINEKTYQQDGKDIKLVLSRNDLLKELDKRFPRLAGFKYHLIPGGCEQNDILTAMARGLNEFAHVFAHNIYAKQPVPALIFTLIYFTGVTSILAPGALQILGPEASKLILDFYNTIAPILGKSPVSQAAGAGTSTAQLAAMALETILNGPNSWLATAFDEFCNDPLTAVFYVAAAYGLGYTLANGIGPIKIQAIQDFFKEEMGTVPEVNTTVLGGKFGILLVEFFMQHKEYLLNSVKLEAEEDKINKIEEKIIEFLSSRNPGSKDAAGVGRQISRIISPKIIELFHLYDGKIAKKMEEENCSIDEATELLKKEAHLLTEQLRMSTWLAHHQAYLHKLSDGKKFVIERRIKEIYPREKAESLCKTLYRERTPSIAYQFLVIPLSYIPALLLVIVSPFISFAAFCARRDNCTAPMRDSVTDLLKKSARDLSRLVSFTKDMISFAYIGVAAILKLPFTLVGMLYGRISGAFGAEHSQDYFGGFMGAIHTIGQRFAQVFNPNLKALHSPQASDMLAREKKEFRSTYKALEPFMPKGTPTLDLSSSVIRMNPPSASQLRREEEVPLLDDVASLGYSQ